MSRSRLPLSDFPVFFGQFQRSAFRLEVLSEYVVEYEREPFNSFRAGQPLPPPRSGELAAWDQLIIDSIAAGKRFRRVHLLPSKLTPYLRFEIEWAYLYTASLGEDIRLLLPDAPSDVRMLAREDFWLFDEQMAVYLIYDQAGRFLGVETDDDPSTLRHCCDVQSLVWTSAVPLREYLATTRTA